jgi:hypothetical protein
VVTKDLVVCGVVPPIGRTERCHREQLWRFHGCCYWDLVAFSEVVLEHIPPRFRAGKLTPKEQKRDFDLLYEACEQSGVDLEPPRKVFRVEPTGDARDFSPVRKVVAASLPRDITLEYLLAPVNHRGRMWRLNIYVVIRGSSDGCSRTHDGWWLIT